MSTERLHVLTYKRQYVHIHKGIYCLLIPDEDFESVQFSECQERAFQ